MLRFRKISPVTNQLQTLEQVKATVVDLSIRFGPKVLVAIIILIVGFFVSRWVGKFFQNSLGKVHMEPPVRSLLVRLIRLLVMLLFLLMTVMNLGVDLLPLVAGLSVAGAGVALAMQGVLGNLAAGLTIIFTRPFRVGEYIQLLNVEGQVTAIELSTTTLVHADKSHVVVPNRKVVGEIIHNYGMIRQLNLSVGVAYGTNIEQALAIIGDVLKANPFVLKDPAPVVGIAGFGDSAINIAIKPWTAVADFGPAAGEIYQAILQQFRANRIEIPFPQREVRMLTS